MLQSGSVSARLRRESVSKVASSARRPTSRTGSFSARSSSVVQSVHATPTRERGSISTQSSARRTRPNMNVASDTVAPTSQVQPNTMKVYIRVRPFSEREMSQKGPPHSTVRIDPQNPTQLTILEPARGFRPLTTHPFTRCFWSVFDKGESDLLNKVDTYLIGGMNSVRRSRAQSMVIQSAQTSVRRATRGGSDADATAAAASSASAYDGAGSAPVMVDANVSHPPYAGQDEVYTYVGKPIVENTLDGYNGCVFAYGQTGSGKTFTMLGYAPSRSDIRIRRESMNVSASISAKETSFNESSAMGADPFESDDGDDVVDKTGLDPNELQGIIPRSSTDLFEGLHAKREKDSDFTYRVEVSYYEIYNEKVFDLIRPQTGTDLKVRHGPTGPYVEDLASKVVNKEEDVARVIRKGMQERHTAATKFNDRSSRSHAILSFNIVQLSMDESDNAFQMRSKLNLVDLAGSERTGAAGAEGEEFHDGVKINQSLTVLGRVIDRLAEISKNKGTRLAVPYRESKLTWVLSDSIGGNSQTSMIATISPHMINYEEMRQTIMYASRAQQVVNEVHRNMDPMIMQLRELRAQIADLQLRLKEAGGSNYTNEYVRGLEKKVKELEWKCADQERTISQLRAELESAGIADPTLVGTDKRGNRAADGAENGSQRSGVVDAATYRRNNEQLQSELQSANKEISRLQTELLESEKKVPAGQPADADAKIAQLQKAVDTWRSTMRDYEAHLSNYSTFQWRWTTDIVFTTFEDKMNVLMRQCQEVMMNKDAWVMDALNRGESEQLRAAAKIQKQHNDEVSALTAQYRDSLDKIRKEYAAKEEERVKRQREVSSTSELRNQAARETYEMEKRRWSQESENMKLNYEERIANMRAEYQEDLKRLRESLTANSTDRQRQTTSLQELQESHEAYVKSITDDMERERKRRDNELANVKKQLTNELARKEEQLNSRDAAARRSEEEAAKLRRDNLKLQTDLRAKEKQLNAEIKDLLVKQENMIALSDTIVSNYEKSPENVGRDIELLRAFISDQDYAAFRAKAKELAYRDPNLRRLSAINNSSSAAKPVATTSDDEKKSRDVEEIRNAIENMRKTRDAHQANMQRVKQDVYEQLSRSRGFQTEGEGGKDGE